MGVRTKASIQEVLKVASGGLIASIITLIVSFSLNVGYNDVENLKKKLETKVDVSVYDKDISTINRRLDLFDDRQDVYINEINVGLSDVKQQNAVIQNDVKWIKEQLKK